jgi:hemerythrin-like domain-containing protein
MRMTIKEFLSEDHKTCDDTFAQLEQLVSDEAWDNALMKYLDFRNEMKHHFDMEEKVMFPAFEAKTGMHGAGPTHMMRIEHEQMRGMMDQLGEGVNSKDKGRFFDVSETLMMLIQQHNSKEEQMLYTIADRTFGAESEKIVELMKSDV